MSPRENLALRNPRDAAQSGKLEEIRTGSDCALAPDDRFARPEREQGEGGEMLAERHRKGVSGRMAEHRQASAACAIGLGQPFDGRISRGAFSHRAPRHPRPL